MRAATAKFRSCFYWFPKKSNACGGAQEGLSGRIGVESLLFSGVPALFLPGSAVAAARRTSNSEAMVPHRDHHRVSSRTRGVTDHRCFVFRASFVPGSTGSLTRNRPDSDSKLILGCALNLRMTGPSDIM